MRIYADHAATTPMSSRALEVMLPLLTEGYGNPSSLHSEGQAAAEVLAAARETVARCIGATPREIVFTAGGSEADNQALLTAARLGARQGKRHIVSTAFEHHAVLHTLEALEKEGFTVTLLPIPADGVVTPGAVAAALRPDTCLCSVMYANNEIGTVQPIPEIGRVCREAGVLFHTDAVQAVGHIPVDVVADSVDLLSLSGHKLGGPKGVGALFVRRGIKAESLIHGGAQERGRRAGTENLPAIAAMAAALEESVSEMEARASHLLPLRDRLRDGLLAIPHTVLNGDPDRRLPSNIHVCFEGIEGESLLLLLDDRGVAASSGSACTSGSLDPSHVLLALGRPHEIAHGSLRLTLGHTATEAEVDFIIAAVRETVETLRGMSPVWRDLLNGKRDFVIPAR